MYVTVYVMSILYVFICTISKYTHHMHMYKYIHMQYIAIIKILLKTNLHYLYIL